MIGRRLLPPAYVEWNQRWQAPNGTESAVRRRLADRSNSVARRLHGRRPELESVARDLVPKLLGPFGFQVNNATRRFEYPWAFHATPIEPGMVAVDLGGSLAGFQFVLAKQGLRVINVDPGMEATGRGWPVAQETLDRLGRAFGVDVALISDVLLRAPIAPGSVDRVYSISTLEHIPPDEIPATVRAVERVLRPGGYFVVTIDLFLNLAPFTTRRSNEYGSNLDVCSLVTSSGLELVQGDPSELCGFPGFDPTEILARLEEYLIGTYPAVAQALVLRKPRQ